MAKDELERHIHKLKSGAFDIPKPSPIASIQIESHQLVKIVDAWV